MGELQVFHLVQIFGHPISRVVLSLDILQGHISSFDHIKNEVMANVNVLCTSGDCARTPSWAVLSAAALSP